MKQYKIWKLGKLSEIKQELVAIFYDLELAKKFILECQYSIDDKLTIFDEKDQQIEL